MRKHYVKLNKPIQFDVLVNGERKVREWEEGKPLHAAVRSRSEERMVDGQKCGVEVADLVVFNVKPTMVMPSIPCDFFTLS